MFIISYILSCPSYSFTSLYLHPAVTTESHWLQNVLWTWWISSLWVVWWPNFGSIACPDWSVTLSWGLVCCPPFSLIFWHWHFLNLFQVPNRLDATNSFKLHTSSTRPRFESLRTGCAKRASQSIDISTAEVVRTAAIAANVKSSMAIGRMDGSIGWIGWIGWIDI